MTGDDNIQKKKNDDEDSKTHSRRLKVASVTQTP